ncbi:NB-ARC domain-containing protein [Xenococcus sp. PCC 7305]|uniref:CHAT domain-containing protein n=1 Tax=Xenococcus sp. PCC 7305 TaxID=102125 RepID=UPI0002AC8EC2|nr:CHAT domain-containing protein [Xenococcus sp. PCC 7305]ELS01456.1 NB-ARC domain-containing protein [Xenococcus sp. PCC 7305]
MELNLRFPEIDQVIVKFDGNETKAREFISPIKGAALKDIQWYLETYAAQYTADVDDQRAQRIAEELPLWGEALFDAVFCDRAAQRLFNDFQDQDEPGKLLTISTSHPAVLSLPWELLRDSAGTYLVNDNPRISIRRRFAGAGGGRRSLRVQPKDRLHMLFVISRPTDAGFINPRGEAIAVLEAIEKEAAGKIEVEFLRPATLDNLVERLEDRRQPSVDIVHFDGHGVFDPDGNLYEQAKKSDRRLTKETTAANAANMGYLLFEDREGKQALITAETLGDMLNRQKVGLMVLSACQSAKMAGEDAMGSVAARLTHAGIPSVLAMTHSVLVTTAQELFAKFYQRLTRGEAMGEALDNARRHLYLNQERGERQRGETRITLKLQDWFLPALYQAGRDTPLLTDSLSEAIEPVKWGNLPKLQEAGFFGRSRELWLIERALVGKTRRLTISGFGGQGKTSLAVEAGRWLYRTGMFEKICFVDYTDFQSIDAVGLAVSILRTVVEQSFIDGDAVTTYLQRDKLPLLIILDNLEVLENEGLQALLDVAKKWSEAGNCRILLTTRAGNFNHPDYPTEGSLIHQALTLQGLGSPKYPEDALDFFQTLMKFPPAPKFDLPQRNALINLFKLVDFHPLSIKLLARQLKERRPADVGQALERLLEETAEVEEKDKSLIASLNLSLERLDPEAQKFLPRLGIFQSGAMEDVLLRVTGLGKTEEDLELEKAKQLAEAILSNDPILIGRALGYDVPDGAELTQEGVEQLQQYARENVENAREVIQMPQSELAAGANEATWATLRQALEATGLMQTERLPGVTAPYLKFHPTLAPVLLSRLTPEELTALTIRYQAQYYQLSRDLYVQDRTNPLDARAVAQRELPNLLAAVNGALDAGAESAVEFVDKVNKFLDFFGLNKDRAALTQRAQDLGQPGSYAWYLARSNKGQQLFNAGRYEEAKQLFAEILAGLGEEASYERCFTLNRLGRCLMAQGRSAEAAECYRQGIATAEQLPVSNSVKRQIGTFQTDLGDVLTDMGDYGQARIAYQESLAIAKELGDTRQKAVANIQLGTLALVQGKLAEAAKAYQEALKIFQGLNEPASEATVWHQMGMVHEEAQQWEAAEQAYRESAKIKEYQGNLEGAAQTWNQLAMVNENAGRLKEAETWYRKTLEHCEALPDKGAKVFNNLADLLQNQRDRLPEARQLAEEGLAIKKTLDPAAAEIWKTYGLLAAIADKQGDTDQAREYRRLSRQEYNQFAGMPYQLQQYENLIAGVVAAVDDAEVRQQLEDDMDQLPEVWASLVTAIRAILEGERDEELLCEPLDYKDAAIVGAILRRIG